MVWALPGHRVEGLDAVLGPVPSSTHGGLWLEMSLWGRATSFLLRALLRDCEPGCRKACSPGRAGLSAHLGPGTWPRSGYRTDLLTFSPVGSHPASHGPRASLNFWSTSVPF